MANRFTRLAEDDGATRLNIAQYVDAGVFDLVGGDTNGPIIDIAMRLALIDGVDAEGVVLIAARKVCDVARDCGGEQQRAPFFGRGVENELHVFAEAQIEHLVGFVQHHGAQGADVEAIALQMVAQTSGRADDDVAAVFQRARLAAHVHAADTCADACACGAIEPDQLALHLHGQFARGRNHQSKRSAGGAHALFPAKQRCCQRKSVSDGLSGAGLCGDQQIAVFSFRLQDGGLNGGRLVISLFNKGAFETGIRCGKGHEV